MWLQSHYLPDVSEGCLGFHHVIIMQLATGSILVRCTLRIFAIQHTVWVQAHVVPMGVM